jgi:hypothetical protein
MSEIRVGDIWRRRIELHDEWDEVRVCGKVFCGEGVEPEWTVTPSKEFGPVVQTAAEGITDFCTRVSEGAEQEWTSDVS